MKNKSKTDSSLAINHISVDCFVLGFNGKELKVLLVKRLFEGSEDVKLPGNLIYTDEDLDEAAERTLKELTGLKNVPMYQFKAYGSKNRTQNPKDIKWLSRASKEKVERIITIVYFSLVPNIKIISKEYAAEWIALKDIRELPFDHNQIVSETLTYIRNSAVTSPLFLFNMLPKKFTALQMRTLFNLIYEKEFDVRNFHKKIAQMSYVIALDEFEKKVSHRAARYYKFDKKAYNKIFRSTQCFAKQL